MPRTLDIVYGFASNFIENQVEPDESWEMRKIVQRFNSTVVKR